MAAAVAPTPIPPPQSPPPAQRVRMTLEQFLALPEDDSIERELIRGELRERPMTRRGRPHSTTMTHVTGLLRDWLRQQPEPRGVILTGDAGFRLRKDPPTTFGIDIAYISPEIASANPEDAYIIEGAPVLAVEILSPSDTLEALTEKVGEYLEAGVKLVWLVEPVYRTVTVYRPDAEPVLFNSEQEIEGSPHLPGFRAPVAALFGV